MAAREQGKPGVQRPGQQETEGGDSQVDAERERRSLQHKPDQVRGGQDHGQEQRDEAEHNLEDRARDKHDKDERAAGRDKHDKAGHRGRDGEQGEEKSEEERVREVEQADKDFPSSWAPTQGTKD